MKKLFEGIYQGEKRNTLLTVNLTPGKAFFQEDLVSDGTTEYRTWDIKRSKLAAAIAKGISDPGIKPGAIILYLGAASGYTVSFLSDIIGEKGTIYAIDFAPRVVRDLYFVAKARKNIIPILGDANKPESYMPYVLSSDILYQDVAQKNQAEILLKNLVYLKDSGTAMIAVKARSIDVTKQPRLVFQEVRSELEKTLKITDYRVLDPFEKDHCFYICRRK